MTLTRCKFLHGHWFQARKRFAKCRSEAPWSRKRKESTGWTSSIILLKNKGMASDVPVAKSVRASVCSCSPIFMLLTTVSGNNVAQRCLYAGIVHVLRSSSYSLIESTTFWRIARRCLIFVQLLVIQQQIFTAMGQVCWQSYCCI